MFGFEALSYTHQVFNEMLKRVFIGVFGQLTYAERRGSLFRVGREDS